MEARIEGFPSLASDLGRGLFPSLSGGKSSGWRLENFGLRIRRLPAR